MANNPKLKKGDIKPLFIIASIFIIIIIIYDGAQEPEEPRRRPSIQNTTITALKNYYSIQSYDGLVYVRVEQNIRSITAVFHMPLGELIGFDKMDYWDKVDVGRLVCPPSSAIVWQKLNEDYNIVLKFTNPDSRRRVTVTCSG